MPAILVPSGTTLLAVAIIALGAALALVLRFAPARSTSVTAVEYGEQGRERGLLHSRLPDHEILAAQERYSEAIHALLLRAILQLARLAGAGRLPVSPSSTSREVVRSTSLAPDLRRTLMPLVVAVEQLYFGTGVAGLSEYATCLSHFRRFEAACRAST